MRPTEDFLRRSAELLVLAMELAIDLLMYSDFERFTCKLVDLHLNF